MAHVEHITIVKIDLSLNSSLFGYSDAYILVSGTIKITEVGADDAAKETIRQKRLFNIH